MRVLVLTSGTGGGHDARAAAFSQWVRQRREGGVEVRIERVLEDSSVILKFGVAFYNWIQGTAPFLHNVYWWIVEVFCRLNGHLRIFGFSHYARLLREFHPQVVLSVHDSTNRGFFRVARDLLGERAVVCATYCGEYTGGSGYSRNWVAPEVDLFCARTQEARSFAVALGVGEERVCVLQNFLPPSAFGKPMTDEERERFLTIELGQAPSKFTVLLAVGAVGANRHRGFLDRLAGFSNRVQAIVICGQNRASYARVERWKKKHPEFGLYLEGYSDRVHRLLEVSDAVVTRGGANTSTEALFFGCPMIYHTIGGSMPQERLTMRYFVEKEAAAQVDDFDAFEKLIGDWSRFSKAYRELRSRFLSLRSDDCPDRFVSRLMEMASRAPNGGPTHHADRNGRR